VYERFPPDVQKGTLCTLFIAAASDHDSRMANHLARAAALLTAVMACPGCVALWQDDHKVEASTGWAVTIEYDPLLLASDRVATTAQSECRKFERVAVLDHVRKGLTWTRIADFHCENAVVYLRGSIASLPPVQPAANTAVASQPYRSLPSPFPTVPPQIASVPAVPRVVTAPFVAAKVASVRVIDASGANSAVTRRQIAKPQVAKTQTISHPVRNLPVASLKRSILS
jgi:hypothetical protein